MSDISARIGLTVENLNAGYGQTVVLDNLSLSLPAGSALTVLGRNGVGKTTLLATVMGMTTRHSGKILLGDVAIEGQPIHMRNKMGLGYVPQNREIFPSLNVVENLAVAARTGGWSVEAIFELFPGLAARRHNSGNRLSGGEQQMLAVARALVGAPKVLLLDEPLEGLAPVVVDALFDALAKIRDESGITILLVEQKAELALEFAETVAVLDRGKIIHIGPSSELRGDEAAQAKLLGIETKV